ncbi:hypothetical protein [Kitasatospora terrestris]|uniref:Integral membrane protein n=1 Tax=Kitasatospora terrestris TaxID=258051 RepID=A0ABP9EEI1_9ACTN
MTDNRATRALRAAVFTALAVPLAALGQVVVTGRALPLTLVAVAGVAVFALALALDGARHRFWQLAAILVPVELVLNTVFNLGQDACASAAQTHGMNLLVCGGDSLTDGSPLAGLTGTSTGALQALVLAVHLALALAAAAWLRLGHAALSGLADALSALAALLPSPWRSLLLAVLPACPAVLLPPPGHADSPVRPQGVVPSPAPRRGPPALALAA